MEHDCLHEEDLGALKNFMERGEEFMKENAGIATYIKEQKEERKLIKGFALTTLSGVILILIGMIMALFKLKVI